MLFTDVDSSGSRERFDLWVAAEAVGRDDSMRAPVTSCVHLTRAPQSPSVHKPNSASKSPIQNAELA